ncbi:gluconokinase, GntK/IdnK-type [Colwellia sp. 6_MG-2023]|uniref:gluconokinase n=1 Tax=Colwellia sp. 6_MG-2023 TaxID=3062676 RepID=UPI0026E3AEC1|nr:gluconokinase, GntK/IdnK-type [Colwellia sp. 6_MG-2023]MDO6489564.1 gluconokinase, GntK/IdnK-type [Colwellia sp. 6_MG-2023]
MIFIVCGVSGTGKSTIGKLLADKLKLPFFDGDDFHPQSNVKKMKDGIALNDNDRQPWLELLATELALWGANRGAVLACSALKESYRKILSSKYKEEIYWVILHGSRELLIDRLDSRTGHFFNSALLNSQLATLELPDYGWKIDIQPSPDEIINTISERLHVNEKIDQ